MNHLVLPIRLAFILFFLACTSVTAQQYYDYEWSDYNITFSLAEDFKEVTNNGSEFTAVGDGMEFGIFPFSDATISDADISDYTASLAESIHMKEIDDARVLSINGLEGALVEGYKDGDRIVLLGFIDPNTDTNFFATITFGDNDRVAEDEAIYMIKSIRKK